MKVLEEISLFNLFEILSQTISISSRKLRPTPWLLLRPFGVSQLEPIHLKTDHLPFWVVYYVQFLDRNIILTFPPILKCFQTYYYDMS